MYGSEELEAGYGWDYAAIGNFLGKNPTANGEELDSAVKDINVFSLVAREINNSDKFGSNNKNSGYTNMVDLGGIVSAGKQYSNNTKQALDAIDEAVVYISETANHIKKSADCQRIILWR